MSFGDAIKAVFSNYANFNGRARRSEFWWWGLFIFLSYIVGIVLIFVSKYFIFLFFLFLLAIIVPTIAVTVRRLHDTDRTGWWWWIGIVPFGGIVLLVFECADSTPDNQYGPNPKGMGGMASGSPSPYGGAPGNPYA